MKAAAAHHTIIQKEVDELLRGDRTIFWWCCYLFQCVLVALYLTLSGLIVICIYLLLRSLISDISDSLFSVVIVLSPLISRMLIYIFLLLSIIIIFYDLFGAIHHISEKVLPFGLATASRFFTVLIKPILFLCHHKGFLSCYLFG